MAGGGSAYDDRVVRARLAQAFGRLIRRQGDRGLFVILSSAMPSRLLRAFPPGVPVSRVPLDVAIARVEERLGADPLPLRGEEEPRSGDREGSRSPLPNPLP
jgi:ATP-dependent DNA helicase DinG